ncbi:hypothetical protein GBAR_LOCUS4607 [Geodia barretti]|uniref:Uncharacterized protein n=1 Tax=Geodia barretti TaxID=519541 RepID=A0AA35W3J0_GEOBA|nr:hypothetical protein GBAR_LOCUS4607 [Geodia barretti]
MLLQLARLARRNGHRFSRSFYREALSKVLQSPPPSPPASTTPTASGDLGRRAEEGREGTSQEMAGELMAMMSGDWDKAVVETEVFWLALHLAREESQVKAVWDEMATSQYVGDESVSVELVRACLRTAGNLRRGTSTHCQSDPSQTVSALVSRLPPRQASVSATAFERVLAVCAESLQLRLAYQTFTSMTLVHALAPTRRGLQGVGRLLCAPALAANRQWRQLRLAFAYRMLEGSVVSFGGWPPAWVFSECARPLTELLGARGFHLMYDLCHTAVVRDHGEENANIVMEEVWGRGLYHALLQSCRLNHGPRLATFFLGHMTHRGILPNERTFRHLLKFPLSPSDIDDFMVVLARHMHCLTVEETTNLVHPLQSLLQRTLPQTHDTRSEVAVEKAVSKLLEVVSAGSMEQHCLLQLASLTQEHSPPSSFHCHHSSDRDTVYERARA